MKIFCITITIKILFILTSVLFFSQCSPQDDLPKETQWSASKAPRLSMRKMLHRTIPLKSILGNVAPNSLPPAVNFRIEEHFLSFSDGQIRYLQMKGSRKTTVLLLHGATFRAELWQKLGTMKRLASRGYNVISADLPRHGKSSNPKIHEDLYLSQFIQKLHLHYVVAIGHSYAGRYLLPFLASRPSELVGAVLVSPTGIEKNRKKLASTNTPTLIIWGQRDELIPVRYANVLRSSIPNAQLKILRDAQHECYIDAADAFHETIMKFIYQLRTID